MKHLHYHVTMQRGDTVIVSLDKQANVLLMDKINYNNYRAQRQYKYFGGLAKTSPIRISAPSTGEWNVVIDLGGYEGTVRASVKINKA
jgi:hypothetical protein